MVLGEVAPDVVATYWVTYCLVTLLSAIGMWYVPYFRGADKKKKLEYSQTYAETRHIFPAGGDNPRPNLLHLIFHLLFVINFGLALAIRFKVK